MGSKLVEFDARDGSTKQLLTVANGYTTDWTADGRTLAYLTLTDEKGSSVTAHLFTQGASPRRLWESRKWAGRGGTQLDEISIVWSPDGTLLLIVVSPLDTAIEAGKIVESGTIFVLRRDGSEAVHSRFGTMARWSKDGTSIVYRGLGNDTKRHVFTLSSGTDARLSLPAAAFRPALSPNGTRIAFDDGQEHPSLFVFDRPSGKTFFIAKNYVAAVWLSQDSLAAAPTKPCGNCEGAQWTSSGDSSIFEVRNPASPTRQPSSIGSIAYGAAVVYG